MDRAAPNPHRHAFRHALSLACQVVRLRDFRLVADTALDLSTRGMYAATHERVLTGEELLVSFRVPRSNRWMDVDATVVRVSHGRRPGDRGRALGLQFHGVDERSRRILFEALRFFPPPAPGFATSERPSGLRLGGRCSATDPRRERRRPR
jgi:hypothetical protein